MSPPGKFAVVPTFHEPNLPDHRAKPRPHKKKYLPGDWGDLMGLAGDLYGYVREQKSSGAVHQLVGWVKALVESDPDPGGFDGKWVGATAHFFTQTFTVLLCESVKIQFHLPGESSQPGTGAESQTEFQLGPERS
jgi:hypothetical protein